MFWVTLDHFKRFPAARGRLGTVKNRPVTYFHEKTGFLIISVAAHRMFSVKKKLPSPRGLLSRQTELFTDIKSRIILIKNKKNVFSVFEKKRKYAPQPLLLLWNRFFNRFNAWVGRPNNDIGWTNHLTTQILLVFEIWVFSTQDPCFWHFLKTPYSPPETQKFTPFSDQKTTEGQCLPRICSNILSPFSGYKST